TANTSRLNPDHGASPSPPGLGLSLPELSGDGCTRSLTAVPVPLGSELSLSDVMQVARGERVELPASAAERMNASRAVVERAVASDQTVYGVTTGFGSLAQVRIAPDQAADLQSGIVRSHAVVGPLELEAKEGLALVNGTQGMLAIGIVAADRLSRLVKLADVAAAMSVEAALGTGRPFEERLQRLRPHVGQAASAANLRALMAESEIVASHRESGHLVQDAYSLRCAPQVHGATRDVLSFATVV